MDTKRVKNWLFRIGATAFGLNVFTACYGVPYYQDYMTFTGYVKDADGKPVDNVKLERCGRLLDVTGRKNDGRGWDDVGAYAFNYYGNDPSFEEITAKDTIHVHLTPNSEEFIPSEEVIELDWETNEVRKDFTLKRNLPKR